MNKKESCIFCSIITKNLTASVIHENEFFLAIMDKYPITMGHTLVIPKIHYDNLLLMSHQEVERLFNFVSIIARAVVSTVSADGFNIGQNNGKAANQIVPHVHVHIIPRFNDDSPNGKWPSRYIASDSELNQLADKIKTYINNINNNTIIKI